MAISGYRTKTLVSTNRGKVGVIQSMIEVSFWSLLESEIAITIASNASVGMHLIIKEKSLEPFFNGRDSQIRRNLIWRTWWSSWSRKETDVSGDNGDFWVQQSKYPSARSPLGTTAAATEVELSLNQSRHTQYGSETSVTVFSDETLCSLERPHLAYDDERTRRGRDKVPSEP